MAFDEDLTKEILQRADIVQVVQAYLPLTRKGRNFIAKCPFHDDNNPSFFVSPEKKMCHCFVCGTGGNAITFVQKYLRIPYGEALRKVAEIIGYSDPRLDKKIDFRPVDDKKETILKCLKDLSMYYSYALNTEEGKEGLDYFEARHLDAKLRSKYNLGYALNDGETTIKFLTGRGHSLKTIEDAGISRIVNGTYIDRNKGRVVFPICNHEGDVIGFSARRLKNSDPNVEKYVNSPETYVFHKSSILYNYHIAKEVARQSQCVYVCEGFMDVFALAKVGMDNAVATMGTALTEEHVELLRRLNVEIRLCLDGDLPGQTASMKTAKLLEEKGLKVSIVNASGDHPKDPDEILNNEGPDALRAYLNNVISRIDFALNYFLNSNPLKTVEQKKKLIQEFIPILKGLRSQLDLDNYLRKLSKITGYDPESIRELLKRSNNVNANNNEEIMREFHPERKMLRKLELAERELLYQMINNREAAEFYEQKIGVFVDEVYRHLANFIIDYAQDHSDYLPFEMISSLENSDLPNKEGLIKELTTLMLEKSHPDVCTPELLNNLLESINDEKKKILEKDTLEQSLIGKDPLERARIIAEYNHRKLKK